ncbi:hypothetical protein [Azospirillum doebereinerae]|uniref:Uncharacterized protein n=1 Tax=Azospirillum doebereinerae TaxID=92933 RepID=A0A3S0VDZ0_9PROT|nr:hypothetical protein [Azospirillum doebereinerae]RUQ61993.1 hypothetical protein EJ913_29375 [Azospirillum doebereinerae]
MDSMGDNGQVLPALSPTDIDTTINHEPRIRDLRLAEALGMADRHAIRRLIERHMDALQTFAEVISDADRKIGRGRPSKSFYLTKKQALYITAKSDTERAALVTIQMVELFDAVTSGAAPPAPSSVLTHADLDAIDRRARRIGQEEERRARSALIARALDRLRRGEPIDVDQVTVGPAGSAVLPPPPPPRRTHAQSVDLAVAHLRALPPELREEGFHLMHAIKAHSEALKGLKAAVQAIHSPLEVVAEILEREALVIRHAIADRSGAPGRSDRL